jgi:competence protein ComEA
MLGLAAIGMFSTLREANSGQLLQARDDGARGAVATREASLLPEPPWGGGDSNAATPTNSARHAHHTEAAHTEPARTGRAPQAPPAAAAPAAQSGITADGKVILNVANVQELDTLPGVGKKTAERIVELRTRLGRFKKLSDLLRIKGIGQRSLQKLTPHLVLDPPPAAVPSAPSSSVRAE